MAGAVVLLLSWAGVAHASGSGWVQAIGGLAAGIVFVGMVGPAVAAVRLEAKCVECPRDATAGETLLLKITTNQPLRLTPRRPKSKATIVSFGNGTPVEIALPTRGVLTAVTVRLGTATPLGLLWWSVERTIRLPVSVDVAPRISTSDALAARGTSTEEGEGDAESAVTGEIRAVRGYVHGDSPRLVHWRATAHTGSLMIREMEQHPDQPVRVVALLPEDTEAAEHEASRAMATIAVLLGSGRRVVLETIEHDTHLVAPVSDLRNAGRRLARAGTNPYRDLEEATR